MTESTNDVETTRGHDLVDTVVDALGRFDARSVVFAVMVALIVLTLIFGLSAEDAVAGARWCPRC